MQFFNVKAAYVEKPAKRREFYALPYLRGLPPIPIPAWQTAGSGASGRRFSGGVTVYLAQKTTVYRHETVDLAGRSETAVHADFLEMSVISTDFGRPETC
jgi:hypothetical protein